jgi:hypothetical protein
MLLQLDTMMISPNVLKANIMWSATHALTEEDHHTNIAKEDKTQIFISSYNVASVSASPQ